MATRRRLLPTYALAGAALLLVGSCDRAPTDGDVSHGLRGPNFAVGDVASVQDLPIRGQDVSIAFDGKRIYYNDQPGTNRLISFIPGSPPTAVTSVIVTNTITGTPIDLDAMAY